MTPRTYPELIAGYIEQIDKRDAMIAELMAMSRELIALVETLVSEAGTPDGH
jgi:hypothetical protein